MDVDVQRGEQRCRRCHKKSPWAGRKNTDPEPAAAPIETAPPAPPAPPAPLPAPASVSGKPTYKIKFLRHEYGNTTSLRSIQCLTCGMTSWTEQHVRLLYCSKCVVFHEGLLDRGAASLASAKQVDEALEILLAEKKRRESLSRAQMSFASG